MDFKERYQYNPTSDLIGKGGFSRVFKATDMLLEREVALKVYTSSASEKYDLVNEIRKVISFEHPNLCRYYDVAIIHSVNGIGEEEKLQVGIMELLSGGDIRTYLNKHPEHLKKLLKDVLEGLSYLHEHGIIHRDLKPQNILIRETAKGPVAKITDFGISKAVDNDNSASSSLLGTIEYMAPEQFNPAKYGIDGKISTNLDLWSFAMLVYELVSGKPMFGSRNSGTSAEQVMSNILGTIDPEIFDTLQEPYREVVRQGLIKDAKERISKAENVIQLLDAVAPKSRSVIVDVEETMVLPNTVQGIPVEEEVTQIIEKPTVKEPKTRTQAKRKGVFIVGAVLLIGIISVILMNSNRKPVVGKSVAKIDAQDIETKPNETVVENDSVVPTSQADHPMTSKKTSNGADLSSESELTKVELKVQTPEPVHISAEENYKLGLEAKKAGRKSDMFNYFKLAANENHASAQYQLGVCFEYGLGISANKTEAIKWYRKSAEHGNANGQYALYGCLYSTKASDPNRSESFIWLKKAANQGLADAQCEMAYFASTNAEEFDWYMKAAKQGLSRAQYEIGHGYLYGIYGTSLTKEARMSEAKKWLQKAANQGNSHAKEDLEVWF